MATREKMLTAVFRNRSSASRVYEWLEDRGYPSDQINVLMSDRTRAEMHEEGHIDSGTMATEGMATGGALGTAVGATLGAIAAIGTSIAIPGLGIVLAGPIVAALAGGGAGAVAGGILGGLVGLGIPESNAQAYEQALREGGVVIGVIPHSREDRDAIQNYFKENDAENVVSA